MSSVNYVADLNDLIREAFSAQVAFDEWDEGYTYDDICGEPVKRHVALDIVVQELDEANLTLVMYVAENHEAIINQMQQHEDERQSEKSETV